MVAEARLAAALGAHVEFTPNRAQMELKVCAHLVRVVSCTAPPSRLVHDMVLAEAVVRFRSNFEEPGEMS